MDKITMTVKQLKRHTVITQVIDGMLCRERAATLLGVTTRQIDRIKKRLAKEGAKSIIHGNSGRKPSHAISEDTKKRVLEIREKEPYKQTNFIHFQELLERNFQIKISYNSLYQILTSNGYKSPQKKRRRNKHPRRQRKQFEGELIQIDATPYEWFGEDKKYALHGAIDDATGEITGLYMTDNECLLGYFEIMRQTCMNNGIPQSVYSDKHTIFRSPKTDKLTLAEEIEGKTVKLTQFGRALDELGINLIHAHSPQAKGRVERLWATLQSRLPVEFALRGITDVEKANIFLKEYLVTFNSAFGVNADCSSLYVTYDNDYDIDNYLCVKHTRKMDNAGSFSINRRCFKVLDEGFPLVPRKASVNVMITTRYGIRVQYKDKIYDTVQYIKPPKPLKAPSNKTKVVKSTKPHLLHSSDPWKNIWHYEDYNDSLKFLFSLFLKDCS